MVSTRTLMLILISLLGALTLTDVLQTSFILDHGGEEINPFMVHFAGDPIQFFFMKCLVVTAILLLTLLSTVFSEDAGVLILITSCGVSIQAVVWNAILLWLV
jgi:hypothetical protein